jgi:hypothetical protein
LFEDDAEDDENKGMAMSAIRVTKTAMRINWLRFVRLELEVGVN